MEGDNNPDYIFTYGLLYNGVREKLDKFLLKSNGSNDLNKMISKVYGCKMGQGE